MTTSTDSKAKLSKLLKERARNRRLLRIFFLIVILSCAFCFGFLFRSQVELMDKLGIPIGKESPLNIITSETKSSSDSAAKSQLKTVYNSLSMRIAEIEDILSSNSFDSVDLDKATADAIDVVLKNTGDAQAKYYSQDEYNKLINDSKNSKYIGIGTLFSEVNGKVYCSDVFDGSEASIKGVRSGDYIRSINGINNKIWTVAEVNKVISENKGGSVVITFVRPKSQNADSGKEITCTLNVEEMSQENVMSENRSGCGYIKINQFGEGTAELLEKKIAELENDGASCFAIDLRGNPGGYMNSALSCASEFIESGTLVNIETISSKTARSAEGKVITTKPISVLIDQNTSAAAEVFAAALKENGRATIVGQTSAGKGVVCATRELSFGGAVRYSAAKYSTPQGNAIDSIGIKPDVEVANRDWDSTDRQLAVAIESALSHV